MKHRLNLIAGGVGQIWMSPRGNQKNAKIISTFFSQHGESVKKANVLKMTTLFRRGPSIPAKGIFFEVPTILISKWHRK